IASSGCSFSDGVGPAFPDAKDIVAIDALVPSHEFLRRIVAEERLKTIDANPTLIGSWHQIGIDFRVEISQRQELPSFRSWGTRI
ncbi:MAG: hypothetical protein SGJ20_07215, partial [Planctomycetota bacterium]|nr:hypothetical protein [Planctomycetota bacterium]